MILKKLISNCILKTFSDKIGREEEESVVEQIPWKRNFSKILFAKSLRYQLAYPISLRLSFLLW